MYDRAELRAETDALWALIREALENAGIPAPARLERGGGSGHGGGHAGGHGGDPEAVWTAPDLVLSQTCGLPFSQRLIGRVALVGTPAYAIPGCPAGSYRSALVVRAEDPADGLAALLGRVAAVNARDSQSGHAALRCAVAPLAEGGRFLAGAVTTGSHVASLAAVAGGRADIAAIDAVTWALAERHEPVTARLRVLGWTEPTPGLPLITAPGRDATAIRAAVAEAIAAAPWAVRDALLIEGVVATSEADYAPFAARLAAAEAASALSFAA